ncbi:hypothetical protein BGW38_006386 [Lunasporangiospora selenospora]|uniref:protein-tyrosine-phosphatase n=1 Tax=Lunasporangiospora selenospora TaxID=979761 RepID=A0A9P6FMX7_9FUNG|nr:hypothetical protein BGW38_006386 [Lunasporangiospora selenospora]
MATTADEKTHKQHKRRASTTPSSPTTRSWPRSSHIKGVLAKKTAAPTALDVVSPYHATTFILTPPSAYKESLGYHGPYGSLQQSSPGKLPSKRVSLQKYYYSRNIMSASRPRTPSPPPSAPAVHLIPSLTLAPVIQPQTFTTAASPFASGAAHAGSSLSLLDMRSVPLAMPTPIPLSLAPAALVMPPPVLTLSASPPAITPSPTPSPTPSRSPSPDPSAHTVSSPAASAAYPCPAANLSPAGLAKLIQQSKEQEQSSRAGSRRPLILDLRPNADLTIQQSININLPTLLMRRYRKGGPISSFALESFITLPSDTEVYHQVLDSWQACDSEPQNVIVLDQDMRSGNQEFGRAATAAWTLVNVLERGAGVHCFGETSIRLWYLDGGFESFQAWDAGEQYMARADGSVRPSSSDVEMTLATTMSDASSTPASLAPKGPPMRRESLFSLNTKSLQRPAALNRAQTVNLKPLSIPSIQTQPTACQQQQNGPWLTVPTSIPAPALSPTMSMVSNGSMELTHSASTDHTSFSAWSMDSNHGSGHFGHSGPVPSLTLNSKKSFSSMTTLNSIHPSSTSASIREEHEEDEQDSRGSASSLHTDSSAATRFYVDYPHSSHAKLGLHTETGAMSHRDIDDEEDGDNGEQEISCILPNFLYLGPEIVTESQAQELERLGVKRILNMATECEDRVVADRPGMEYFKVGVYDRVDADVSEGLMQAVNIIASSSESPIYVHCKAGKSRSVTATIAYLITQFQWPLHKAYRHVLERRPCMCPNIGFVTELMRVEERILGAEKATGLHQPTSMMVATPAH